MELWVGLRMNSMGFPSIPDTVLWIIVSEECTTPIKYWFGASAHHVTEPNISFVDDQTSKLPMKLSLQGGIKFDLVGGTRNYFTHMYSERSISFAFNYKQQDPFSQLDIGAPIISRAISLRIVV